MAIAKGRPLSPDTEASIIVPADSTRREEGGPPAPTPADRARYAFDVVKDEFARATTPIYRVFYLVIAVNCLGLTLTIAAAAVLAAYHAYAAGTALAVGGLAGLLIGIRFFWNLAKKL